MRNKETQCVHPLIESTNSAMGVTSPIFTSMAYDYAESEELVYPGFFTTTNQKRLGSIISKLEGGAWGLAFNSGMAAITAAILSLVRRGDHIIFSKHLYGGTWRFANEELRERGITVDFAESLLSDFKAKLQKNTKLIYLETPSNPLLSITDLEEVATWARKNNIITIVDNTFATPINQQPILLGIDIVIHSGTKYLGGHNDLSFGALVIKDPGLKEKFLSLAKLYGGALSPFTCYMAERSIKTLSLRVHRQNKNALHVATYLEKHPMIRRVYYPGLPSHPGHKIARKQMLGFGGILSFEIAGDHNTPAIFMSKLFVISPALSLGGVESLICVPSITSHKSLSQEERIKIGITDNLLRLSIGIEHEDDLIKDLRTALDSL